MLERDIKCSRGIARINQELARGWVDKRDAAWIRVENRIGK
jgi:hypothetical protein